MRAVLPRRCRSRTRSSNLGRVALGVAGIATGRYELLRALTVDRLHERYRARPIPQLPHLVEAARDAGAIGRLPVGRRLDGHRLRRLGAAIARIEAAFTAVAADTRPAGRGRSSSAAQRGRPGHPRRVTPRLRSRFGCRGRARYDAGVAAERDTHGVGDFIQAIGDGIAGLVSRRPAGHRQPTLRGMVASAEAALPGGMLALGGLRGPRRHGLDARQALTPRCGSAPDRTYVCARMNPRTSAQAFSDSPLKSAALRSKKLCGASG